LLDKLTPAQEDYRNELITMIHDLTEAERAATVSDALANFNHQITMGAANLDTATEQYAYLNSLLGTLNLTEKERWQIEENLVGIQKQINEELKTANVEYINQLRNRFDVEQQMHSQMFDTTAEQISFYIDLINQAVSKGLDPSVVDNYRDALEVLQSPFKEYTDKMMGLDRRLDLTPELTEGQAAAKNAFELSTLKAFLAEYENVLSDEDLHALKKRIFNIEIEQNVQIRTGDILQAADWDTIVRRLAELMKTQGTSWSNIVLSRT